MKIKYKITISTLSFFSCMLLAYVLWLSLRPVEIVTVHHRSSGFSDILVKNFPLTDKGKIDWWLENSKNIRKKYQIPKADKDGAFYLTFWLFGEGYKEEGKYDRLCFKDMQAPTNCIDKNAVFSVGNNRKEEVLFTVYDGRYRMEKGGKIIKLKDE